MSTNFPGSPLPLYDAYTYCAHVTHFDPLNVARKFDARQWQKVYANKNNTATRADHPATQR